MFLYSPKAPNLVQSSPMSYCLGFRRAPYGTAIQNGRHPVEMSIAV